MTNERSSDVVGQMVIAIYVVCGWLGASVAVGTLLAMFFSGAKLGAARALPPKLTDGDSIDLTGQSGRVIA